MCVVKWLIEVQGERMVIQGIYSYSVQHEIDYWMPGGAQAAD